MNNRQCKSMEAAYIGAAKRIRENIDRWPGAFDQLFIWQSEERVLLAHAEAYRLAAFEVET